METWGLKAYLEKLAEFESRNCFAGENPPPSLARFLLAHGQPYQPDAATYKGRRRAKHQCFKNAGEAALYGPHTYVEGYISVYGVPMLHAWLVSDEGRLIDPTLRPLMGKPDKPGEPPPVREYFGVAFRREYIERVVICENKVWGILGLYRPSLIRLITGSEPIIWKPSDAPCNNPNQALD